MIWIKRHKMTDREDYLRVALYRYLENAIESAARDYDDVDLPKFLENHKDTILKDFEDVIEEFI